MNQNLWLLILVPLVGLFLVWAWRKKQLLVAQFVQSRLLAHLTVGVSSRRQKFRMALTTLAVAFIVIAMARPQWGFKWEEARQKAADIVICIDTSKSMLAEDIAPNRLERAKLASLDIMKLCKTDRFGLVAFAGSAFLQCPLTMDDEAFRQNVAALDTNIMPQGGTALADAIQTALAAFKDEGENQKVIILFTDGEDHDGGAVDAAKRAAELGVKIFTVGIGGEDGELIRVPGASGNVFLHDRDGNIVKSRLNKTLLQQISGASPGFYLNLGGQNAIEILYERGLATLARSDTNAQLVRRYFERFYWPLGMAVVLLLFEMFLPDRKRSSKRVPRMGTAPAGTLERAAAVLALCLLPLWASAASPTKALEYYHSGEYEKAREEYEKLTLAYPDDARVHFNRGTAAYQAKRFDEAEQSFLSALASKDTNLVESSYYNLGNTLCKAAEKVDAEEDIDGKIETYQKAEKYYGDARNFNRLDGDVLNNLRMVRERIELLKKQREEQEKQDQQSQSGKDDKKKKKKKKKDGKQQSQDGSDGGDDQTQDPQKKDQNQKKDKQKDGGEKPDEEKDKGDEGNQQQNDSSGDKYDQQTAAARVAMGQMTFQQAQRLLDAQKSEERALIFRPDVQVKPRNRTFKDW